jgi:hypothetical protein
MGLFSVVLTILVLLAVAVFVLLYERKRARRIEQDLRSQAREGRSNEDRVRREAP